MFAPCTCGSFPFDAKFRFEFPEIFSDKWNIIFWNFRNRGQPYEVYRNFRKLISWREFSFHFWLSSHNLRNFRLNSHLFGNLTIFRFSQWKLSLRSYVTFVAFLKYSEFSVQWKATFSTSLVTCQVKRGLTLLILAC